MADVGLTGTIAPLGTGTFPTHRDTLTEGGYRAVADAAARDAIPTLHRKEGMLVYTQDSNTRYILGAGLTNGDWTIDTSGGGTFTAPTGTGFMTVTSSAMDAAGTANIRYTGGKFQTDGNVQWNNSSITGDLAWTPTSSNKTLTLPDATDTLVGKATSDVFTNKTYSLSGTGNVFTDTSIAQYDLVMANSTPVFRRFAKGSNSTLLGVSSGGVVQYAAATVAQGGTGLTSIPGSANEVIINNATTAYGAATNVTAGTGFIGIGSGTLATTGVIRLPYNNAPDALTDVPLFTHMSSGGTNVRSIVSADQDIVYFGGDTQRTSTKTWDISRIAGQSASTMLAGGSFILHCVSNAVEALKPITGSSGTASVFGVHGVGTQAMADSHQLSVAASVYKYHTIVTTGANTVGEKDLQLPSAGSDLISYTKTIKCDCTGFGVRVRNASGTTVSIGVGKTAMVLVWSGGVHRITADSP
jgi:hypothetical protein